MDDDSSLYHLTSITFIQHLIIPLYTIAEHPAQNLLMAQHFTENKILSLSSSPGKRDCWLKHYALTDPTVAMLLVFAELKGSSRALDPPPLPTSIWVLGTLEFSKWSYACRQAYGASSPDPFPQEEILLPVCNSLHPETFLALSDETVLCKITPPALLQHSQFSLFLLLFQSMHDHLTSHIMYSFVILSSAVFDNNLITKKTEMFDLLINTFRSLELCLAGNWHSVHTG